MDVQKCLGASEVSKQYDNTETSKPHQDYQLFVYLSSIKDVIAFSISIQHMTHTNNYLDQQLKDVKRTLKRVSKFVVTCIRIQIQ